MSRKRHSSRPRTRQAAAIHIGRCVSIADGGGYEAGLLQSYLATTKVRLQSHMAATGTMATTRVRHYYDDGGAARSAPGRIIVVAHPCGRHLLPCSRFFLYEKAGNRKTHHTIDNLSSTQRPKKWTGVIVLLGGSE